jgi:hypothetical protein
LQAGPTIETRILFVGVRIAAAGAFVSIIVTLRPDGFLPGGLDPGGEGNIFAWASTVATFAAAYASVLLAFALPDRWFRFTALALSFAFLSLDDMTEMHERLGEKVFDEGLDLPATVAEQLEVLLYAPVFAVALWITWTLARESRPQVSRVLVVGMSLLALAVVTELSGIITRKLEEHGVPRVNGVRVGIEETAELAGWILVATALTALACAALASQRAVRATSDRSS